LASIIAQEKMQIIMQKPYEEVLATALPKYRTDFTPNIPYDDSLFRPETVVEGGMTFTRLTYIQVLQEVCYPCVMSPLPPFTPDTGMRQITVTVIWRSTSGNKSLTLHNILNNPNTVMSIVNL